MNTKKLRKSFWQSLFSILAFGLFAYLALGSFGTSQQATHLGNGVYEVAKYYSNGQSEVFTGTVDKYGKWHGEVKIEHEIHFDLRKTEVVTMVHGLRHGESRISLTGYPDEIYCYNMGVRVDCEKSAYISSSENSAFQVLIYKYPWFRFNLNAFGFENDFIKTYLDTLETVMGTFEFELDEFDDYYQNALDEIEGPVFDSIILINSELALYYGFDLLKNSEFRMAVIDGFRKEEPNTFNEVKTTYPNYLLSLNEAEVSNPDFEIFCHKFDSLIINYGELDVEDPFFLDSLDDRMYRAMEYISNEEGNSSLSNLSVKSASLAKFDKDYRKLLKPFMPMLKALLFDSPPPQVAAIVLSYMYYQFSEADIVKLALKEAYQNKKGIVQLPTVTTEFSGNNSATSAEIKGFVIENGGADVSSRGIAWASVFNPTINEHSISSGTGTGKFTVSLTGLNPDETYYARAFATNSAGTAYGNCISFKSQNSTLNNDIAENTMDFKVFPNPATTMATFSFQLKTPENISVTLFNMNGQEVIHKDLSQLQNGDQQISLDISSLENGNYTCRLTSKEKILGTSNLVISR